MRKNSGTHVALVALLLGTHIFMSFPFPSYAERSDTFPSACLHHKPVMWTPYVVRPNSAHAARSSVNAAFAYGFELEAGRTVDWAGA